jgi:hypothetical protein
MNQAKDSIHFTAQSALRQADSPFQSEGDLVLPVSVSRVFSFLNAVQPLLVFIGSVLFCSRHFYRSIQFSFNSGFYKAVPTL